MAEAMNYYGQGPLNPHNLPSLAALNTLSAPEIGMRLLPIWQGENRLRTLPDFARGLASQSYSHQEAELAAIVLMEGLQFLVREGHLVRDPTRSSEFYVLSRSGTNLKADGQNKYDLRRSLDAREIMHPLIVAECVPEMERGRKHYPDAIFKAYRRVEIAVREKSKIDDYGVALMRAAFKKDGPLAEKGVDLSEVEALAHLYAGAIGRLKNPGSHRDVEESDVQMTMQLLAFASYLLTHLDRIP